MHWSGVQRERDIRNAEQRGEFQQAGAAREVGGAEGQALLQALDGGALLCRADEDDLHTEVAVQPLGDDAEAVGAP